MIAAYVSTVTADEINQQFGNGLAEIFAGIWTIISPFAAGAIILWLFWVGAKKLAGRSR